MHLISVVNDLEPGADHLHQVEQEQRYGIDLGREGEGERFLTKLYCNIISYTILSNSWFMMKAHLQVAVVAAGEHLVPGVQVEHRVQTLGGAGVLLELLHLTARGDTRTREDRKREGGDGGGQEDKRRRWGRTWRQKEEMGEDKKTEGGDGGEHGDESEYKF